MHLSGEPSPSFIRPMASPAVLMWMRGSRGWYALQTAHLPLIRQREIRRWKIAAPLVAFYLTGVAIAGAMPSGIESGSATIAIKSQKSHDPQPRQIAGVRGKAMPVAAQSNERIHASYFQLYDDKRRQASGGLLSIGSASAAVMETANFRESHDRERRQFTSPYLDLPRPTTVAEEQMAPRTGSASPKRRLRGQAPRRSVDYPHLGSEQDHISYASSSSVPDISTSSLSKLPPVESAAVTTGESEIVEKHASIGPSVIPRPIRKPPKPIKSVKALTAKAASKKAIGRCQSRIWRC
jgi:hypothetical protein